MHIEIRQSYHKKEQFNFLDDSFVPMDNTANLNPELREYRFFQEHYRQGKHKEADYSGIVSWKFNQKTKIEGRLFIDFIKNNPGFDVYFINPFPHEVYLFQNVWLQGEACHPGTLELAQKVLNQLNCRINLKEIENRFETALYCNFWVGNEYFWDEYMKFTQPVFNFLLNHLTDDEKKIISRPANKTKDITATNLSYIMERLFSTLIVYNSKIKALAYKYPCVELQIIRTFQDQIGEIQKNQQFSPLLGSQFFSKLKIPILGKLIAKIYQ